MREMDSDLFRWDKDTCSLDTSPKYEDYEPFKTIELFTKLMIYKYGVYLHPSLFVSEKKLGKKYKFEICGYDHEKRIIDTDKNEEYELLELAKF